MPNLPITFREIAPPKDPGIFSKVEQDMRDAQVGLLVVLLAFGGKQLGVADLGGLYPGRVYVEPEALSLGSGCELYSIYH